jgi:hypothetical protein
VSRIETDPALSDPLREHWGVEFFAMISDQMLLRRLANVRERAEGLLPSQGPIPDLLGHANISTTQRYMHLDDRELADVRTWWNNATDISAVDALRLLKLRPR